MTTVMKKRIKWTPAPDPDIVEHWVFVVPEGNSIDPAVTPHVVVPAGTNEIIAPDQFPAGTFSGEGNFNIGICAVDDVGNLSDVVSVAAPFDFVAPNAPTNLVVETI